MCSRESPKKIAEFEDNFHKMQTKIDTDTIVLFEDESYIRDYQALCATWVKKGQQKKIKTFGQHKGVGLFGVLDYNRGNILVDTSEQLNAQAFEAFFTTPFCPLTQERKLL